MARIYLSPSTQDQNTYAAGGTNEEEQMRQICFPAADLLRAAGHTVRIGGTVSARANAEDANAWGNVDYYAAVHTNTGGGHGTETWCFGVSPTDHSAKGYELAQAIQRRVGEASLAPDRGVKFSTGYIELNTPKAPSAICELVFHDDKAEALEVVVGHAKFARAIAQALCDVAGGVLPGEVVPSDGDRQSLFVVMARFDTIVALGFDIKAHQYGLSHDLRPLPPASKMVQYTKQEKDAGVVYAGAAGQREIEDRLGGAK